jgi:prepilin-type N-terminal cleavage/methylation domain-containing protein
MKGQRGFTLLEMMIVVAIIAILAMLLIPNFTHARAQAQTAACESNLRAIGTAMELYYTDNQSYPSGTGVSLDGTDTLASKGYLPNVPHDPAASAGSSNLYKYTSVAASGSTPASYTITCPGVHDPGTLAQIQHATASSTGLFYHSGNGLDTR